MAQADLPTEGPPWTQPTVAPDGSAFAKGADLGRYRVLSELGRGGMGVVYRAHDKTLGREVAMKALQLGAWADESVLERFHREARAAASLDHPNIIHVLDVGTLPGGAPYYTMDLLEGKDMGEAIHLGRVSVRQAVEVVRQVAGALGYAHRRGVLHRDLKPQNVFLRRPPSAVVNDAPTLPNVGTAREADAAGLHAVVLDFGLAKIASPDFSPEALGENGKRSLPTLTRSGEVFGTPAYMAPEQARGAREVDARADVYALGATLYHALAGAPPFQAATLAEMLEKVQRDDPTRPSAFNAEVDADLDTICLKCLQKDPIDRYADAAALEEDLRRALSGESIAARPVGLAGRVWRRAKRNRRAAVAIALLACLSVGEVAWVAGRMALRAWGLSRCEREYREALARSEFAAAAEAADRGRDLSPNDARWRERRDEALYESSAVAGRAALAEWRTRRARAEALHAGAADPPATAEERDARREARWKRAGELRAEEIARDDAWAKASVAFTEALTHVDRKEAREALTELSWDRYVRAEADRDSAAMRAFEASVIQFGGEAYSRLLRGKREVRVRFALPEGYGRTEVTAYLCEYRPCLRPPVVVPVPYDVARGRAVRDAVENLAGDDATWKAVPLAIAEGAGADARAVEAARGRSILAPSMTDANKVVLPVRRAEGTATPSAEFRIELARGSYVLSIPAGQGLQPARYPFEVARDRAWDEASDLVAEAPPVPPGLPAEGRDAPCWVYIAAGPFRAGGDSRAQQNPPHEAALVRIAEGYFLGRFEVTAAMYLAYLNDRGWHPAAKAFLHAPRMSKDATKDTLYWKQDASGAFALDWAADWPAFSISCPDAEDYCRWLTKTLAGGWEFRLPTEDEWEKAARGVDGRSYPWGEEFDETFCAMVDARPGEQRSRQPEPIGLFPMDDGPYGVRDMSGGVYEWTATPSSRTGWRRQKGGNWASAAAFCRCAARDDNFEGSVSETLGFRVLARRTTSPR